MIPAGYVGGAFWGGAIVALSGNRIGATVAATILTTALMGALLYVKYLLLVRLGVLAEYYIHAIERWSHDSLPTMYSTETHRTNLLHRVIQIQTKCNCCVDIHWLYDSDPSCSGCGLVFL